MHNPGQHAASDGNWRSADLIASLANAKAQTLEADTERAGTIYMLAEILTALHRQAEALEARNQAHNDHWNEINQSILPKT